VRSFRKIGLRSRDGPESRMSITASNALDTPADHPARDTQDTFFGGSRSPAPGVPLPHRMGEGSGVRAAVATNHPHFNPQLLLLRTHTSSVQIRVMEKTTAPCASSCRPPFIAVTTPMPLIIPRFIRSKAFTWTATSTGRDLKGTVEFVFKGTHGTGNTHPLRPHYFSYTEPSFEIDFSSPADAPKMGKNGFRKSPAAAMVHPAGFRERGYDPEVGSAGRLASASSAWRMDSARHQTIFGCFTRMMCAF